MMKTSTEGHVIHLDLRKGSDFHFELNETTHELKAVYKGVDFPSETWNEEQWRLYKEFSKLASEKLKAELAFNYKSPHLLSAFIQGIAV